MFLNFYALNVSYIVIKFCAFVLLNVPRFSVTRFCAFVILNAQRFSYINTRFCAVLY